MILKEGESLVHLKLRINKEMSELTPEQALEYRDELTNEILKAMFADKFPQKQGGELLYELNPDRYSGFAKKEKVDFSTEWANTPFRDKIATWVIGLTFIGIILYFAF